MQLVREKWIMKDVWVQKLLVALFVILPLQLNIHGQTNSMERVLNQRAVSFAVKDTTLNLALQRVAREFDLAVGFESLPDSEAQPNINVNIEDGTLRDVLNSIIANDKRYFWTPFGQTIDVSPLASDSLIKTIIPHYEIQRLNRRKAVDVLVNAPEIQSELQRRHIRRREFSNFYDSTNSLKTVSLDLKQATVREILNAIAEASHSRFWTFHIYGKQNEYFSVRVSQ